MMQNFMQRVQGKRQGTESWNGKAIVPVRGRESIVVWGGVVGGRGKNMGQDG